MEYKKWPVEIQLGSHITQHNVPPISQKAWRENFDEDMKSFKLVKTWTHSKQLPYNVVNGQTLKWGMKSSANKCKTHPKAK